MKQAPLAAFDEALPNQKKTAQVTNLNPKQLDRSIRSDPDNTTQGRMHLLYIVF